jgi:hypothetical protein
MRTKGKKAEEGEKDERGEELVKSGGAISNRFVYVHSRWIFVHEPDTRGDAFFELEVFIFRAIFFSVAVCDNIVCIYDRSRASIFQYEFQNGVGTDGIEFGTYLYYSDSGSQDLFCSGNVICNIGDVNIVGEGGLG